MRNFKEKCSRILKAACAVFISAILCFVQVNALEGSDVPSDDTVYLVDFASGEIIDNFYTFTETKNAISQYEDDYKNLGIVSDGVIYYAQHAIVLFNTSEACDVNVTYKNAIDDKTGFTNGCFGIDAALIDLNNKGDEVEFLLSGVLGWASIEDVTVVPIENINSRLSSYTVDNGTLYHEIKSQMIDDNYSSIINNGKAPSYLQEGSNYYSYDGHYFYPVEQISTMFDDYQKLSRENSVNPEDPYYNYYQFVSHRTMTTAKIEELQDYLTNVMGIKGAIDSYCDNDKDYVDDTLTRSQLYGTEEAFYHYQYEYGANALMMLAIVANESEYGSSSLSYTRNNLFGHAAYDSDDEANSSRYRRINNSIYSHAKYYISGSYASPLKAEFNGSFFGNKSTGMNVNYSSDPYWGEKAAAYYRNLDESIGSKDDHNYTLAIKNSQDFVYVYQYPEEDSQVLYSTGENPDYAFVILDKISNESGEWYKVQAEPTLNEESLVDLSYYYDYQNNLGYIKTEDVQVLIDGNGGGNIDYVHVTFDANGGIFNGGDTKVTYAMPSGTTACADLPMKDHALFTGWDQDTDNISADTVFKAVYKDVDRIEVTTLPKTDYELYDRIDLKNGILTVYFKDGTSEDFNMNSSMVFGYSLEQAGNSVVHVEFAGASTEYSVSVSAEKDEIRTSIKNEIVDLINKYGDLDKLTDEQITEVLALKEKIDGNALPYLTQTQLRSFDRILRSAIGDQIRYVVNDNSFELGVSGLSVSMPIAESLSKSTLEADTYRVAISEGVEEEAEIALNREVSFLEGNALKYFDISVTRNFEAIKLDGPVVFTINKPENSSDGEVFTVLYFDDEDGDVIKCYTRQTESTISFMSEYEGQYVLLSRRTSNEYAGSDPTEAVTAETASYDIQRLLTKIAIGLFGFLILFVILFVLFHMRRKKKVRKARRKKQRKAAKEPAPPVDFTQAMHVFETEVMNLEDISNAAEYDSNYDYDYDDSEWYQDRELDNSNYLIDYSDENSLADDYFDSQNEVNQINENNDYNHQSFEEFNELSDYVNGNTEGFDFSTAENVVENTNTTSMSSVKEMSVNQTTNSDGNRKKKPIWKKQ